MLFPAFVHLPPIKLVRAETRRLNGLPCLTTCMVWATLSDDFCWHGVAMDKLWLLNCVTARTYCDALDFPTKFILIALYTGTTHETVIILAATAADSLLRNCDRKKIAHLAWCCDKYGKIFIGLTVSWSWLYVMWLAHVCVHNGSSVSARLCFNSSTPLSRLEVIDPVLDLNCFSRQWAYDLS